MMEILNKASRTNSDKQKKERRADILFSPITINKMVVPNRILMPAMHLNMIESSYIGDRIIAFYAARARGGAERPPARARQARGPRSRK